MIKIQKSKAWIIAIIAGVGMALFISFGSNKAVSDTALELEKVNILFSNIDNPLKIVTTGCIPSELKVSIDNGAIEGREGEYIARPGTYTNAIITVKCKDELLYQSSFRVMPLKNVVLALQIPGVVDNYITKGRINKSDLLEVESLKVIAEHYDIEVGADVVEFTLGSKISGELYKATSHEMKLTQEQKDIISKAEKGDKIFIEDVKIAMPEGDRKMPSVTYVID